MTAIVTPPSPIDPVPPVASSPPREVARRRGIRRATLPTPPYGDHGILTDDGERVQCHICGRWFDNLGSHTARAHRVSARSYKARFGLKMSVGLIGPALRAALRAGQSARRHSRIHPIHRSGSQSAYASRVHRRPSIPC